MNVQPSFPKDVLEDYMWEYGGNVTQGRNSSGTDQSFLTAQLLFPVTIELNGER